MSKIQLEYTLPDQQAELMMAMNGKFVFKVIKQAAKAFEDMEMEAAKATLLKIYNENFPSGPRLEDV